VAYDFSTVDSEDYDGWARIATWAPGKRVRLELETTRGNPSFDPLEYEHSPATSMKHQGGDRRRSCTIRASDDPLILIIKKDNTIRYRKSRMWA
jgi:hypothetical protein